MLTFLEGSAKATAPDTIKRDGKTYKRREIAAYAVREDDLTSMYDCTGAPGTLGTYAIGRVRLVLKWTAKQSPAPWLRVQFHVVDWQGTVPSWLMPTQPLNYAPRDVVEVWRATK